jgi:tetratricopeptide (TPR) repeat protein
MPIVTREKARKYWIPAACFALTTVYLALVTCQFMAWYFGNSGDFKGLQLAARLAPGNSEYRYRMGRYIAMAGHADESTPQYQAAISLNPYDARYWLSLAQTYQVLADTSRQAGALEKAIHADPTSPSVAWEAANFYLMRNENPSALRELRVVLESDPASSVIALQRCWRALPNVDELLAHVVPHSVPTYLAFLDLLMSRQETSAAAKVWNALMQLHRPVEPRYVFDYVRFAIRQKQPEQAGMAWQQAAALLGWSEYLPTPGNLLVNGDFSLDVLNGGFDWNYQKQPSVALVIDPSEYHSGHNSLSIAFDGPGVNDAGIYQFVSVAPNTDYEFDGFYKSEDLDGAGGPVFSIHDLYGGQTLFQSDELKDADFWKPVHGQVLTGPETRLVVLSVDRVPAGSPIRGKLWIDDLRLVQNQP